MRHVLLIGATSAIAQALARRMAAEGDAFYLVARHAERLQAVADDLLVRGAAVAAIRALDVTDTASHAALPAEAAAAMGQLDTVIVAHGTLPDQPTVEQDATAAEEALRVNLVAPVSLLTHIANHLAAQGHGQVAVITSVAGLRGRKSNYVYGAAKGGLDLFTQGLRNRLHALGVHVCTVRPGFVDTPMTAHIQPKGPLFATPERVAADIHRALRRKRDVVYTPWFWWPIMTIIRAIPERLFKRLSL